MKLKQLRVVVLLMQMTVLGRSLPVRNLKIAQSERLELG